MLPGAATFDFAAILAVFSRVLRRDSILYPWDVEICRVAGSFDVSVRTAVFLSSVYLSSTFPRGGVDMGIVSHLTKGCNSDLRDGFLGSIPGTDCWDGLSGRIFPALGRVSARPVIARTILDSPRTPATDRHQTFAEKLYLGIGAPPIVPSAARGYGANCLDRMVPKRERSLASGTIGPAHLARCQDVSTHSLALDVSTHSPSPCGREPSLTSGLVCERSLTAWCVSVHSGVSTHSPRRRNKMVPRGTMDVV